MKQKYRIVALLTAVIVAISAVPFLHSGAATMDISENGIEFIKSQEGFSAKAYYDYGQWSIGYGSKCEENEYPNGITESQAEALLVEQLQTYIGYVNDFLNDYDITVNQNQFDALTSFTYNLGNVWDNYRDENGEATFLLKTYLINGVGNYTDEQIKTAFGNWCNAGGKPLAGLIKRRAAEAELFLTPTDTSEQWRVTASSGLRLRASASTSSSGLDVIPTGTALIITEKKTAGDYNWGKTTYAGKTGWCALYEIVREETGNEIWIIDDAPSGMRLRSGAGTSYTTIATIPNNTRITVTQKKTVSGATWGKTSYAGKTGWCSLQYSSFVEAESETTYNYNAEYIGAYQPPVTTKPTTTTVPTTTRPPVEGNVDIYKITAQDGAPVYAETSLESQQIALLPVDTTITASAVVSIGDTDWVMVAIDGQSGFLCVQNGTDVFAVLDGIHEFVYADANGDGKVTVTDVMQIRKYVAELSFDLDFFAGDANADGKITAADVMLTRMFVAELDVQLGPVTTSGSTILTEK